MTRQKPCGMQVSSETAKPARMDHLFILQISVNHVGKAASEEKRRKLSLSDPAVERRESCRHAAEADLGAPV